MVQFYSTCKGSDIATPLVTRLSWTKNLLVLIGFKTEERQFYLQGFKKLETFPLTSHIEKSPPSVIREL